VASITFENYRVRPTMAIQLINTMLGKEQPAGFVTDGIIALRKEYAVALPKRFQHLSALPPSDPLLNVQLEKLMTHTPRSWTELFLDDERIYDRKGFKKRCIKLTRKCDDQRVLMDADKLAFLLDVLGDCRIFQSRRKAAALSMAYLVPLTRAHVAALIMSVQLSEDLLTIWEKA
jgi:hypothetical protein